MWTPPWVVQRALSGTFAKSGKKVTYDGGPVPAVMPKENTLMFGPLGPAVTMLRGLPPETFMVYVYATPEDKAAHRERLRAGDGFLFYKTQHFSADFEAISEIFKRAPKGLIGVAEVVVSNDEEWRDVVYINMMSVRPAWKRNGLNMAMVRALLQTYPDRKLEFSAPTPAGRAFIDAARAAGLPVVEGRKR